MFNTRYAGLRIFPSRHAARELLKCGLMIEDCKEILEQGYEPRKRKKGTIERWLDAGDKTYNIVIARNYDEIMKEEVWTIIHLGGFTKRK